MEETTITNQHPLKEEIEKQHPQNTTKSHTRIYAIRTILYAIVAVWLRFLKDKDIDVLFESFPKDIKDNVAFIITLLKQSKEYNVDHDSATKYAKESAASILNYNSDDNFLTSAKYAASAVAFIASDAAASISASDAMKAAESAESVHITEAKYVAEARRYAKQYLGIIYQIEIEASVNARDAAASSAVRISTEADKNVILNAKYAALLYLISAYLYLKI